MTINALSKSDSIQNLKITDLHTHLLFDCTDPILLAGVDNDNHEDTSLEGVQGDNTFLACVPYNDKNTSLAGEQGDNISLAGVPIPTTTVMT